MVDFKTETRDVWGRSQMLPTKKDQGRGEKKKNHEKQQEKMPTWGTVLGPTKATVPAKAFQVSKEDNMASLRVLLAPDWTQV